MDDQRKCYMSPVLAKYAYRWCLILAVVASPTVGADGAENAFIEGRARFEVLAPVLVRIEYSPSAEFIDAPSVSVVKRAWPAVPLQAHQVEIWFSILTRQALRGASFTSPRQVRVAIALGWFTTPRRHVHRVGLKEYYGNLRH
jgi:hypothetical protein